MSEHAATVPADPRAAERTPVRVLGLRLLAALLAGLWSGLAIALLVAYRPGGPLDQLVGTAAFLPVAVAAVAIIWPPIIAEWRPAAVVAWLGIISALLIAPLLLGIIETLATGGRQELFPSAEVAYAGTLALGTTCLFGSLGLVGTRWGGVLTTRVGMRGSSPCPGSSAMPILIVTPLATLLPLVSRLRGVPACSSCPITSSPRSSAQAGRVDDCCARPCAPQHGS